MGIGFRPARRADASGLAPLVEELGYPAPLERIEARLARLETAPDQALFVAEDEGAALCGWIHVQEFVTLATDPTGLVTGLVVGSAARGRGIGRALMRLAEDWARARGLTSMRLRSRVQRREAHAFYARLGYSAVKTQLQFRKDLD
jgi:ribosomal protein S18 acetylase RimI-like enzyme